MKNKKFLLLFILNLISLFAVSQTIKRDPDSRKDYANVFYKTQYTLFDLWSDEPIFPDNNKIYHIYYATNEDKTPKEFNGTAYELSTYTVYKFKNYENCKNWCDGVVYKSNSYQYSATSNNTPGTNKSTNSESSAAQILAQLNSKNQNNSSNLRDGEKCIEGDCINRGTILYSNGDVFKGKFINGKKSDGEYKWINGNTYTGRFKNNDFEYGELKSSEANYTGSFKK